LLNEGLENFNKPYDSLLKTIADKKTALVHP
jgi:hypothetical protein